VESFFGELFFAHTQAITFAPMPLLNWGEIIFYVFAAVSGIQLFYYSWFFARVAFHRTKSKNGNLQHPVSVVICARDEDENLARNLPGVLVQKYPTTHEVVVVNDNSVDDSKYILQELKKTFRSLHVVELTQEAKLISGKKYPLSVGSGKRNMRSYCSQMLTAYRPVRIGCTRCKTPTTRKPRSYYPTAPTTEKKDC